MINNLISENSDRIKGVFYLFLVFAILKAIVYFAPLGINEISKSLDEYGAFEYSFNLGQTFMGVLSMGFASAYGFFIFKHQKNELKPLFHLHFTSVTFLIILTLLIFPNLLSNIYFGSLIIATAFANQIFLSHILKFSGKNKRAVLVDTVIYIVMAILVITGSLKLIHFSLPLWFGSILTIIFFTTIFFHLKQIKGLKQIKKNDILALYKYGGLIIIASPLLVLITSSTRLYIEYFSSFKDVGIYSLYFRVSSLALIFSRVVMILLLRKMFKSEHQVLDKFFSSLMMSIFILNIILFFGIPLVLKGNYPEFEINFKQYSNLFLLCFFQISFWINTSLFEPILQRENKMKQFIGLLAFCFVLLISSIFLIKIFNLISLVNIVWLNTFYIFCLFCGQQWILWGNKIIYKKSLIIQGVMGVLFFCTLFIL